MQRAVIVANGKIDVPSDLQSRLQLTELIIAADGGTHNCKKIGLQPDVIIGDLDSMTSEEVNSFRSTGVELIQYPSQKDETDLELALQYTVEKKIDEVVILGALGDRWDMTIANILLLTLPLFRTSKLCILDGTHELILVWPGDDLTFEGVAGDTVSLIPVTGDAGGIRTEGLEYSLKNEKLLLGATRGVSNVLTGDHARITLSDGLLLCVINRQVTIDHS